MPDIPGAALAAAAQALREAHAKRGWNKPAPWWAGEVATAVLEAAAPLLAETIAQKILLHMQEHDKSADPASVRAWRRHFGIAARVAAGAFYTREDELRLAAEAIGRGDFIACDIPEVPDAE